jgi:hypothetical protein
VEGWGWPFRDCRGALKALFVRCKVRLLVTGEHKILRHTTIYVVEALTSGTQEWDLSDRNCGSVRKAVVVSCDGWLLLTGDHNILLRTTLFWWKHSEYAVRIRCQNTLQVTQRHCSEYCGGEFVFIQNILLCMHTQARWLT